MELEQAIKYFDNQKVYFRHILEMAAVFERLDEYQWNDAIAKFHNDAGRLDYALDNDFGALVLERESDNVKSKKLQRFFLHHALLRAEWCAQSASAGGELIARGQHVDSINRKLSSCT
jgi:hypothetical protein